MNNYERAYAIKDEIVKNRRAIHQYAEVGFDLPQTTKYVMDKLTEMGFEPKEITQSGVTAICGKPGGKTFLLRADMDALPMKEDTGLEYCATNGNGHCCGHDTHTAMLLGAAKILKERESELEGCVKFMFQPAEELLTGAEKMVKAGVLENPKVDCAMMLHIYSQLPKGVGYTRGIRHASSNNFRITITGKGSHGAMPELGVDPVLIGAHIIIALQELTTREVSFAKSAVLTAGHFKAGSAVNIIPDTAMIEGTTRTYTLETQQHFKKRIVEVATGIAAAYRGKAEVEFLCDCPVNISNEEFTDELVGYIKDLAPGKFDIFPTPASTGSEDFAFVSSQVPATAISIGAADPNATQKYPMHNIKVTFDEDALPLGTSVLVESAMEWLKNNK